MDSIAVRTSLISLTPRWYPAASKAVSCAPLKVTRDRADTWEGMDNNSFSFRAPALPWRLRVDPRKVKLATVAVVVASLTAGFTSWVIGSERNSEARAAEQTVDDAVMGVFDGPQVEVAQAPSSSADAPARADARTAAAAAREASRGRPTLTDAGPGQLSAIERSLVFTDGASAAPGIVSVAGTDDTWAGAVMGASGACYWIRLGPSGTTFGTGELCTGSAALSADEPAW